MNLAPVYVGIAGVARFSEGADSSGPSVGVELPTRHKSLSLYYRPPVTNNLHRSAGLVGFFKTCPQKKKKRHKPALPKKRGHGLGQLFDEVEDHQIARRAAAGFLTPEPDNLCGQHRDPKRDRSAAGGRYTVPHWEKPSGDRVRKQPEPRWSNCQQ